MRQIAQNMVAEVCSFYVLRADGVLELYATEGLNPDAVHLAQLKMGQGLVGTIAASADPLNLSDAQSHPAFAYLPETGEEIYNVLSRRAGPARRAHAGRAGRAEQGAADLSRRRGRGAGNHGDGAGRDDRHGRTEAITRPGIELDLSRPVSIKGDAYGEGIGLGHVVLHEPRVVVTELFNDDIDQNSIGLTRRSAPCACSIDDMLSRRDVAMEGEHRAVLEAYRMFAHDRGWVRRLKRRSATG